VVGPSALRSSRSLTQIDTGESNRFPGQGLFRLPLSELARSKKSDSITVLIFMTYGFGRLMHRFGRVVRLTNSDFKMFMHGFLGMKGESS
jgi:hypothetical protein